MSGSCESCKRQQYQRPSDRPTCNRHLLKKEKKKGETLTFTPRGLAPLGSTVYFSAYWWSVSSRCIFIIAFEIQRLIFSILSSIGRFTVGDLGRFTFHCCEPSNATNRSLPLIFHAYTFLFTFYGQNFATSKNTSYYTITIRWILIPYAACFTVNN